MEELAKKRGRPAGSTATKKEVISPAEKLTWVTYKVIHGSKFAYEKTVQVKGELTETFLGQLERREQQIADQRAESLVHVNVPSEYLQDAFEKKRITARVIISLVVKLNWFILLLLLATPVFSQTQYTKKYIDMATNTPVAVNVTGNNISVYWLDLSKPVQIVEFRSANHSMTCIKHGGYHLHDRRRDPNMDCDAEQVKKDSTARRGFSCR